MNDYSYDEGDSDDYLNGNDNSNAWSWLWVIIPLIFFLFIFPSLTYRSAGHQMRMQMYDDLENDYYKDYEYSNSYSYQNYGYEDTTITSVSNSVGSNDVRDLFLVTRVIDGDTIEIEGGDRVRLICIDTPEVGEEGYYEAKDFLSDMILNRKVILEKDVSETDRYGRLLRYVYLYENGQKIDNSINYAISLLGYGKAYPYPSDTKLCDKIQEGEDYAKRLNKGIWEESVPDNDNSYSSNSYDSNSCGSNVYNCGDFNTCSEVMEVFDSCSYDVNELDGDDDGVPCEALCG